MKNETEYVPLKVEFDWKAYYYSFVEKHGEPVEFKGKLLFRDGWTYALDYKGPEWPPPNDRKELQRLQTYYWQTRLGILRELLKQANRITSNLVQTQGNRSCPLLLKSQSSDEPLEVTPTMFDDRIDYLSQEIEFVERQIENLKSSDLVIRTG